MLLVVAHFIFLHTVDLSASSMPNRAPSVWAVIAEPYHDVASVIMQAVNCARNGCPLMTSRLDSTMPLLRVALLVSVLLVLGLALARPGPRRSCLPLRLGPARQALLQRFTL